MQRQPNQIPLGYCQCGCGEKAPLARCSNRKKGKVKGEPLCFIHGHNQRRRFSRDDYAVDPETGCWVWQHSIIHGYGYLWAGKSVRAHRYYYERAKGPIAKGLELDHLCRNRACVNPGHLEPVTRAENARRSPFIKLTVAAVREIRARVAAGEFQHDVAADFGVNKRTVSKIVRRERWKDV